MKKVYFYLVFDDTAGCWKSMNFNSFEQALESKEQCSERTSPIVEGWIKE